MKDRAISWFLIIACAVGLAINIPIWEGLHASKTRFDDLPKAMDYGLDKIFYENRKRLSRQRRD